MARLVELQSDAEDSLVEYAMNVFCFFALLIIVVVYSSWTTQQTMTRQVGEEHSVIRVGSRKFSKPGFQQRENMYLRISRNVFQVHRSTSYRMLHEVCYFSGRGWTLISPEILRTGFSAELEDKETQYIDLSSLYAKVSGVLWCKRYDRDAII